jgi:hypothetical protein
MLIRFDGDELPSTLEGIIVGMVMAPAVPVAVCLRKVLLVDFIIF